MKFTALMMSDMTSDELHSAIQQLLPDFKAAGTAERLSGGNINKVWRVDGDPYRVIAKHAPPHIATNPDVPLSSERISFEAKALSLFSANGQFHQIADQKVRPPKLYAFAPDRSLLLMEDVGDFKELNMIEAESISSIKTGERLGRFIGNLHRFSFGDDDLRSSFNNFDIQKVRHQLQYEPAYEYGEWKNSSTKTKIKNRSRHLGERLQGTGTCLIMGDLWPPSVLINETSDIRLIDWEFMHFGRPLQDVGHFAAHCWMQGHVAQRNNSSNWWDELWSSFIDGYKHATGDCYSKLFNYEEKNDIGIHIGTEILIRAFGPFREGYVYESFNEGHQVLNEAKEAAVDFVCNPNASAENFGL